MARTLSFAAHNSTSENAQAKKKQKPEKKGSGGRSGKGGGGGDLCRRSGNFCRRSAAPESCGLGLGFLIFFVSRVTQLGEASRRNASNTRQIMLVESLN